MNKQKFENSIYEFECLIGQPYGDASVFTDVFKSAPLKHLGISRLFEVLALERESQIGSRTLAMSYIM